MKDWAIYKVQKGEHENMNVALTVNMPHEYLFQGKYPTETSLLSVRKHSESGPYNRRKTLASGTELRACLSVHKRVFPLLLFLSSPICCTLKMGQHAVGCKGKQQSISACIHLYMRPNVKAWQGCSINRTRVPCRIGKENIK